MLGRIGAIRCLWAAIWVLSGLAAARPVSTSQVEQAASGWMRQNQNPMGKSISRQTQRIEPVADADSQMLYYVVHLKPQGFMVFSVDDAIEPVIAFSSTGHFDGAEGNPLKILLERDMKGRLEAVKQKNEIPAKSQTNTASSNSDLLKQKWQSLFIAGAEKQTQEEGGILYAGAPSISDVRVSPFLLTKWNQGDVTGSHCYNYYTPNNYPTGCVATAMAQLMRYHSWPTAGIGVHTCTIHVDDVEEYRNTLGGNGSGGPYNWSQMPYDPQAPGLTATQRQAIGALCYDAGLSVGMGYTSSGSGAGVGSANEAFKNTFGYTNSVFSNSFSSSGDAGLWGMMNADLDAQLPVLLGISGPGVGHAIVADGYGYNSGLMYHHLNMGWGGADDAWYQLPNFTATYTFNAITDCVYNIYPGGTGEIVSGRITSMAGAALEGVTVTAYQGSTPVKQATTNSRGIYALKNLASSTSFRLSAIKSGYAFVDQNVSTGSSQDWNAVSGNKWGINFTATNPMPPTAIDQTVDVNSLLSMTIRLEALDDHLPNPPDKIRYSITALPVHGMLNESGVGSITAVPYLLAADANSVQYTPCQYFGGQDSFTFKASDGGTATTGGDSNTATVTVHVDNTLKKDFGLDGTTGTNTMIDTERYACRSQVIYLGGDIGSAKTLTDLALNFTGVPPLTLRRWTVRMRHTDWTEYPNSYDKTYMMLTSGWTIVYQADLALTSTGWHNFHFQTPFQYNGTQNLLIDFSFDNLNTNSTSETGWYLFKDVGTFRSMTIKTSVYPHADPLTWDFWAGGGYYTGGGWLPSMKLIGTVPIDPMVGDFDASCNVKLPDLAIFSAAWMTQQGQADYNPACDISSPKDNVVNLSDLLVFATQWMQNYQY
jgi:hypothetical protein